MLLQSRIGGGERVRTDGLLRARQALSQLSYTPKIKRAWRVLHNAVYGSFFYGLGPLCLFVVGLDGIEPSTSRLSGVRSNQTELQALGHTPLATLPRPV